MITTERTQLKQGVYGRVRVVEGWGGHKRLYVKRTSENTYVLSTSETLSLDSMISVGGDFHFETRAQLCTALERNKEVNDGGTRPRGADSNETEPTQLPWNGLGRISEQSI